MNIALPISMAFAHLSIPFLAEIQWSAKIDDEPVWAHFIWILLPNVLFFMFVVWCKRKMDNCD